MTHNTHTMRDPFQHKVEKQRRSKEAKEAGRGLSERQDRRGRIDSRCSSGGVKALETSLEGGITQRLVDLVSEGRCFRKSKGKKPKKPTPATQKRKKEKEKEEKESLLLLRLLLLSFGFFLISSLSPSLTFTLLRESTLL